MIKLNRKEDCCGCSACAGVCPKQCISIKPDEEGFYYPYVDENVCISCGLCNKICPVINKNEEKSFLQDGYVVQNRDWKILHESTSGGAFTAIASYVIENGGYVVGASMNLEFQVEHIIVDKKEDLQKFRNSKYVQSYISPQIYRQVKKILKEDRIVLFSGTGCQIEGLVKCIGNSLVSNLICIDVVCRAVPSPLIFKKYIEYQSKRNKLVISSLRFRDKYYGYKFPTLAISNTTKLFYHRGIESDPWLRAFFSGICNRPSCYECVFKKQYRISDITLWDCFNYEDHISIMKRNAGATNVLVHTDKGRQIFENIKKDLIVKVVDVNIQVSEIKQMTESAIKHPKRLFFFQDALMLDGFTLFKKYFPITIKEQILYYGRFIAVKTGIYSYLKSLIKADKK